MTVRKSLTKGRAKYEASGQKPRKSSKVPSPLSPPKIIKASRGALTPAGTTANFTVLTVTPATALKAGFNPHKVSAPEQPIRHDPPNEPSLLVRTRMEVGRLFQKGMDRINDLLPEADSIGTGNESDKMKTGEPNVDDKWARIPEDVNGSFQEGDFGEGCFDSGGNHSDEIHKDRSFSADHNNEGPSGTHDTAEFSPCVLDCNVRDHIDSDYLSDNMNFGEDVPDNNLDDHLAQDGRHSRPLSLSSEEARGI